MTAGLRVPLADHQATLSKVPTEFCEGCEIRISRIMITLALTQQKQLAMFPEMLKLVALQEILLVLLSTLPLRVDLRGLYVNQLGAGNRI